MSMRQLQGLLENAKREVTLLEEHVSLLKTDCEARRLTGTEGRSLFGALLLKEFEWSSSV